MIFFYIFQKKSPGRSTITTTTTTSATSQNNISISDNFDEERQIHNTVVDKPLDKTPSKNDHLSQSPVNIDNAIDMTNSVLDMNNNNQTNETKNQESDNEDSIRRMIGRIQREGTFDKMSTADEQEDDTVKKNSLDKIDQEFDRMASDEHDKIDDSHDMSQRKPDVENKKKTKKSKAFGSSFEKALSKSERSNTVTSETQSSVIKENKEESENQRINDTVITQEMTRESSNIDSRGVVNTTDSQQQQQQQQQTTESKKHRKSTKKKQNESQKDQIEKEDESQKNVTKSKQRKKPRSSSMQDVDKSDKSSHQVSNRRKSVPAPKSSESVEIEKVEPTVNQGRIDSPSSDINPSGVVDTTDSQQKQEENIDSVKTEGNDNDGEVSDVSDLTDTDIEDESDDGTTTNAANRTDSVQSLDKKGMFSTSS